MHHPTPRITDEVLSEDHIQYDLINSDLPDERAPAMNYDADLNDLLNNNFPGVIYQNFPQMMELPVVQQRAESMPAYHHPPNRATMLGRNAPETISSDGTRGSTDQPPKSPAPR